MGRKKTVKGDPNIGPDGKRRFKYWNFYDDKEFDTEEQLIQYQRQRHFRCTMCGLKAHSAGALGVHMEQVHHQRLNAVPNALPDRNNPSMMIIGIKGVPPHMLMEKAEGTDFEKQAMRIVEHEMEKVKSFSSLPGLPVPPAPSASGVATSGGDLLAGKGMSGPSSASSSAANISSSNTTGASSSTTGGMPPLPTSMPNMAASKINMPGAGAFGPPTSIPGLPPMPMPPNGLLPPLPGLPFPPGMGMPGMGMPQMMNPNPMMMLPPGMMGTGMNPQPGGQPGGMGGQPAGMGGAGQPSSMNGIGGGGGSHPSGGAPRSPGGGKNTKSGGAGTSANAIPLGRGRGGFGPPAATAGGKIGGSFSTAGELPSSTAASLNGLNGPPPQMPGMGFPGMRGGSSANEMGLAPAPKKAAGLPPAGMSGDHHRAPDQHHRRDRSRGRRDSRRRDDSRGRRSRSRGRGGHGRADSRERRRGGEHAQNQQHEQQQQMMNDRIHGDDPNINSMMSMNTMQTMQSATSTRGGPPPAAGTSVYSGQATTAAAAAANALLAFSTQAPADPSKQVLRFAYEYVSPEEIRAQKSFRLPIRFAEPPPQQIASK
ncbi:unnamed protein product [Amoebophrya sp. A25]|nr:unnamed protein product [Amoebophrya sp. A25]|eukprot:GSA25T00006713001.1